MTIRYELVHTQSGHVIVRSHTNADVSVDDVTTMIAKLTTGEYAGKSVLSVIEADTKYSPEARMAVRKVKAQPARDQVSALVLKSATQRIVLGFMMKVGSLTGAVQATSSKVFETEDEAMIWIDQMLSKKRSP